jgi:hypothetical protein
MQPQTATITAKYVNQIKTGKKFGGIKDTTDNMWWCDERSILDTVQPGQSLTISYTTQKWSSGPANIIAQVLDGAPRTQGTQAPQPTPDKPAQPSYRSKTVDESVEIFVCAMLPRIFQGTGQIPPVTELASMIYNIRRAWITAMEAKITPLPPRGHSEAVPVQGFVTGGQATPKLENAKYNPEDYPPEHRAPF